MPIKNKFRLIVVNMVNLLLFFFFFFLQPLNDNNSIETEKSSTRSEYAGYSFQ